MGGWVGGWEGGWVQEEAGRSLLRGNPASAWATAAVGTPPCPTQQAGHVARPWPAAPHPGAHVHPPTVALPTLTHPLTHQVGHVAAHGSLPVHHAPKVDPEALHLKLRPRVLGPAGEWQCVCVGGGGVCVWGGVSGGCAVSGGRRQEHTELRGRWVAPLAGWLAGWQAGCTSDCARGCMAAQLLSRSTPRAWLLTKPHAPAGWSRQRQQQQQQQWCSPAANPAHRTPRHSQPPTHRISSAARL